MKGAKQIIVIIAAAVIGAGISAVVVQNSFSPGRVLVYSDAGLLKDQTLIYGDNQFLLEVESLDQPFLLYFIHAGGSWFFRGLSGYVV